MIRRFNFNAGLVKRGDKVVCVVSQPNSRGYHYRFELFLDTAKRKEVYTPPQRSVLVFVNGEVRVDFMDYEDQSSDRS